MTFQLPHIISWSHRLVREVLLPGDLAVDLTAGRGRDTLELCRAVGPEGCVLSFDIQEQALSDTRERLECEGVVVDACLTISPPEDACGAWLIHADHRELSSYLSRPPRAVIANLGYLPGGDRQIKTRPDSTGEALQTALSHLLPGGRLVCVLYTAHEGGAEEAATVERIFTSLSSRDWFVLRLQVANRVQAPYLLVVEKR